MERVQTTKSRAQLMTGCYAPRVGVPGVFFPAGPKGLNLDEHTVAEYLRDAGYATMCVGKWHLGDQQEFLPTRHGFDHYFGIPYSNDMQRNSAVDGKRVVPLLRDDKVAELLEDEGQRRVTREYTTEAIKFIKDNRDRPIDGKNVADLLLGKTSRSARKVWHYFQGTQLKAVRMGPWKLALGPQSLGMGIKEKPQDLLAKSEIHRIACPVAKWKATRIEANIDKEGVVRVVINGEPTIGNWLKGPLTKQPQEDFCVGHDNGNPVDRDAIMTPFSGTIDTLVVDATP